MYVIYVNIHFQRQDIQNISCQPMNIIDETNFIVGQSLSLVRKKLFC